MMRSTSIKQFADCLAYCVLEKVQKIEDEEACQQVREATETGQKLAPTYKFAQLDLADVLGSHGEHRVSQLHEGVYSKHHTKCWLHKQPQGRKLCCDMPKLSKTSK